MVIPLPPKPFFGPWVRFHDYDLAQNLWSCSVLLVVPATATASAVQGAAPALVVSDQGATANWQGFVLDTFEGWNFWRFNFSVQLTATQRRIEYWPQFAPPLPEMKRYSISVPGVSTPLHWGFKSCDWFSGSIDPKPYGGHTPVWNDVMMKHAAKPLHLMVGGGDQLYNDPIFDQVPELKQWKSIHDRTSRENMPTTPAMMQNIESYYFRHYCDKFSQPVVADVYASIPQMLMWDDHDIFDGWGSYPDRLLRCDVFQKLYKAAERFYLLFQHHTNAQLAEQQSGLFGDRAYNFVKLGSPDVAFVGLDIRAQRTVNQVITPSNYTMIFDRMRKLPGSVKHLVVISTVPIVYPEIPMSEQTMRLLSGLSKDNVIMNLMGKTGLHESVMKFDEPELLDDLVDHWTSAKHKKERIYLLNNLQQFAQERACRVTIISGDVHLACVGLFYTNPKMSDPKQDHRWMMNITSSAIVNAPPPKPLVKMLTTTNHACNLEGIRTREKMVRVFKGRNVESDKLMARRNWCAVTVPPSQNIPCTMAFELRCEHDVNSKATSYTPRPLEAYLVEVPPLTIRPTKPVPVPPRPTPATIPAATHSTPYGAPSGPPPGASHQPGYPPSGRQPGYPSSGPQPGYPPSGPQPGYPPSGPQPGYPPSIPAAAAHQPGYPPAANPVPGYPAPVQPATAAAHQLSSLSISNPPYPSATPKPGNPSAPAPSAPSLGQIGPPSGPPVGQSPFGMPPGEPLSGPPGYPSGPQQPYPGIVQHSSGDLSGYPPNNPFGPPPPGMWGVGPPPGAGGPPPFGQPPSSGYYPNL